MVSRVLLCIALLGVGLLAGYGLAGSMSDGSQERAPTAGHENHSTGPELRSDAAMRARITELASESASRAKEVNRLTKALAQSRAEVERLHSVLAESEEPGSPEAIRSRALRYYFDPRGWDFDQAVAGLRSISSRLARDALVVHENDFEPFMKAVWSAKLENASEHGVRVPPDDAVVIEAILTEHAHRYRRYMYEEYRPRMNAAETREEMEAIRTDQAVRFAEFLSGMQHAIMRHLSQRPSGRALYDELVPYL